MHDHNQGTPARNRELTQARLKELLYYDPDSGEFIWRKDRGRVKAGAIAGHRSGDVFQISIDGVRHSGAKLAWLYTTGEYPEWALYYANRDFTDTRIGNLSYRGEQAA